MQRSCCSLTAISLGLLAPVLCLPWGLAAEGAAPSPLRLDAAAAQDLARDRNPDIQRLVAETRAAGWKRLEAAGGMLPHLSAGADQTLDERYEYITEGLLGSNFTMPEAGPTSSMGLEASWTVFDGLGSFNAWHAADAEYQASRLELKAARFHLDRQVLLLVDRQLAARELVKVADQDLATLHSHLDLAQANEDSGMGTAVDVLRLEAQLEEAQADRLQAANSLQTTRDDLGQLLGVSAPVEALGALPLPPERAEALGRGLDPRRRDEMLAQARRLEAAQDQSLAATAFWLPKVSLYMAQTWYRYSSAFDPAVVGSEHVVAMPGNPADNYLWSKEFGVRASWDLFDGGISLAKSREAAAHADASRAAWQAALLKAPRDAEQARRQLETQALLFKARQRGLAKSEESVRLATLGLKAGTRTHTEVLDAELELFRARAGLIKAQADAMEAFINLELALGETLE
jgi:outer membrane protein TolC